MQVDYAKTDSTGNYVLIQYKPANSTGLALKKGYVNTKHVLGGNPEMVKQQWLEDKGFEYEYQDKGNAPIFSGTPTQSQVRQGFLGDCYLVATISAIVQNNHRHITNMMNDLGDAVRVRFFLNDNPVYVTVDKQVPSFAGSKSYTHRSGAIFTQPYVRGSLWASLLEKAYAVFTGQTYAQLESGGKSHEVLKHMVNISATERSATNPKSRYNKLVRPWYDHKVPSRHDMRERARETEKSTKLELFKTIFQGNSTHVMQWKNFVEQRSNKLSSISSYEEMSSYLTNQSVDQTIQQPIMNYLFESRMYSGVSGSGLYTPEQEDLFKLIKRGSEANAIMTAGTPKSYKAPPDSDSRDPVSHRDGIHAEHAYVVLNAFERNNLYYLTMRNPWGMGGIKYTREDTDTRYGSHGRRKQLFAEDDYDLANDGVFEIELTHFQNTFHDVTIPSDIN